MKKESPNQRANPKCTGCYWLGWVISVRTGGAIPCCNHPKARSRKLTYSALSKALDKNGKCMNL